jgi:hypothetical protein
MPIQRTERYIPNLLGKMDVPYDVAIEIQRIWRQLYDLTDRRVQVEDRLLTRDTLVDPATMVGKPLLVILRQDTVGGWATSFGMKFKGVAAFGALTTAANTYTALWFYPTSDSEVLLVSGLTGGAL